jgi:hypothetical protein
MPRRRGGVTGLDRLDQGILRIGTTEEGILRGGGEDGHGVRKFR